MRATRYVLTTAPLAAGLLALLAAPVARAQRFALDAGFGTGGKVLTSLSTPPASTDQVLDAEAQPGDKLLVLARNSGGLLKLRYNADGTLDAGYGTAGRLALAALPAGFTAGATTQGATLTDVSNNPPYDLLPDGQVLVRGVQTGTTNGALALYAAAGTLSAGFGPGGVLTFAYPIASYALQADGKLLVASLTATTTSGGVTSGGQLRVERLLPGGTVEFTTTLAPLLVAPAVYAGQPAVLRLASLLAQADGKILVAGNADDHRTSSYSYVALARLNADGTPDTGFGTDGTTVLYRSDPANANLPMRVATLRPMARTGGQFVLNMTWGNFSLLAFTATGQVDAGYGSQGQASLSINQVPVVGIAYPQADGSLLAGGASGNGPIVGRLTSAGAFDPAIAAVGSATPYLQVNFGGQSTTTDVDQLTKVVTMPSGALLVVASSPRAAASSTRPAGTQAALARYAPVALAARVSQAAPEISLYPNPVAGAGQALRLAGLPAAQPVAATLYNALGQVVLQAGVAGAAPTLALPALPAGLYRLHLAGEGWATAYPLAVQ